MRILAIVKLYAHKNRAGGELYLHHLLKKIKTHDISVIIPDCKEIKQYEYEGIKIFETNETNFLEYIDGCDILISQLDFAPITLDYAIKKNKRCMLILHCYVPDLERFIYNENVLKIFNSKYVVDCALRNNKFKKIDNYKIIFPYTDFEKYSSYFDKKLNSREYITLINPSRSKGGDVFVELIKKYPERKFMVVVGGYYPHLQDLGRFKKFSNCHIQENTPDIIKDVYLKSRIVLMSSRYETYGMVASECRAMGLPCIINKNAEGLLENMGKIGLYAFTPLEDATQDNIETYSNLIEVLDHKPTYILWSDYLVSQGEKKFIENMRQIDEFLKLI